MQLSNAHYVNEAGWYDITVTPDEGEPFDYTVSPDDPAPMAVAIRAAVAEQSIAITAYVAPPSPVPSSISSRQGKIQLLRMGLMTAEEASAGTPPCRCAPAGRSHRR